MHPDRLPRGTPLGWGTVDYDHNSAGLYHEGPQPARNPLGRLIQSSVAHGGDAMPPVLARLILTKDAMVERRLQQMLTRARISAAQASLDPDKMVAAVRQRLRAILHTIR